MDVRKKLIEILEEPCGGLYPACELADYLLSNGVTVQECKLGVKKTNADRIRNMSDEELAMCLYEIGYDERWDEPKYALEWLRQPVEGIE